MNAFFNGAHCWLCLLKDLTFKAFAFVQLTCIEFQLETEHFLFVMFGFLLYEFCWIKLSCQPRDQPTITNINVTWRPVNCQVSHHNFVTSCLLIATMISFLVWVSHKFNRSIEDLLNLFTIWWKDQNFPSTLQFFLPRFSWLRKFKIYWAANKCLLIL